MDGSASNGRELVTGDIGKTLVRFALPFVFANLLQVFYGAADMIIVGRFCDAASVAAVGVGSQIMMFEITLLFGLSAGGTVIIGQRWGAEDSAGVRRIIGTMSVLFPLAGLVMTGVLVAFADDFVVLMMTPQEAVEHARRYVLVCSLALVFVASYNVIASALRGLGDSKTPLRFIIFGGLVNVAADLLLVGVFGMGVYGAALATSAAQALSVVYAVFYLKGHGIACGFHVRDVAFSGSEASAVVRMGAPIALQNCLIDLSFLVITAIVNSMGLIASAGLGVAERLIGFAMLAPGSLAAAVATMTSQNIGAGFPERAKGCFRSGVLFSLFFGAAFCIYCQFAPSSLTMVFSSDQAVVAAAADYLRSFSIDCVFVCYVFNANAFFSGCGHTVFPMIHSVASTFLLRVPVSYLLSRREEATLFDVGFAAPAASLLSIVMCFFYYRSGRWKRPVL